MASGPNRPVRAAARSHEARGDSPAGPVFVDASGRRRRRLRRASLIAVVAVGAYAIVLGVGVLGGVVPPNVLLPIGGAPAAPSSSSASPAASGAAAGAGGAPFAGRSAPSGLVPAAHASGASSAAASSAAAGISPTPSMSPSPSANVRKPTAPPGQGVRSATAKATGHGH